MTRDATVKIRMRQFSFAVWLALVAFCAAPAAWAEAGAVVSVWGQATVERSGAMLRLVENSAVEVGDTLNTGRNGYLYVRMTNGEEIYLRPGTSFEIEDYAPPVDSAQPETGRSFYRLLRGAFRAVTHSLGRRDFDSYRISSVTATMGIRGSVVLGALDESNVLYYGVDEGGGVVSNANGTLFLEAGEFATVEGLQFAPQPLSSRPGILSKEWTPPVEGAGGVAGGGATSGATAATVGTAAAGAALAGIAIGVMGNDDGSNGTSGTTSTNE